MAIRFNTAKQVALAGEGVTDLTVLDVYASPTAAAQPASANDAPHAEDVLLGSITGIVWDPAGNPAILDGAPFIVVAVASGDAVWGRFRNPGDTLRMDGLVGAEFTLAEVGIIEGGEIRLTAAGLTQPSGE